MDSFMKIRTKAMLGTHHSWAVTIRSLMAQYISMGHDVYMNSINGYDHFPDEWSEYSKRECRNPDIDITYTLPRNFKLRFREHSGLKLAIYNYETSILPKIWVPEISHIDYALPSSNFSKEVFVNSGWPEEKCIVVPHGINLSDFEDKSKVDNLKTRKKFKFLNVSIPHYRKNIDVLIDAYYSAFTDKDDVCLLLKTTLAKPKYKFECDVVKEILKVQKSKKHRGKPLPQVEVVQHKYDSMIPLYNSCDCLVSATSAEGFGLPLLEALAANMVVIAPRCTGHLDFLNDSNSLLAEVKEIKADERYQYWRVSKGATTYLPDVESLAHNMKMVYNNYKDLKIRFDEGRIKTINEFSWEAAARQILGLL